MRHIFVSALRGEVNDYLIRQIVGHGDQQIQDKYTHDDKQKIIGKTNNVLKFPSNTEYSFPMLEGPLF